MRPREGRALEVILDDHSLSQLLHLQRPRALPLAHWNALPFDRDLDFIVPDRRVDLGEWAAVNYEVLFNPSEESLAPIDQGFHKFNLAHLGEETISKFHRVLITAKDEAETIIGGVHGEMYWDWLHIHTLWVAEEHRGVGIGSKLLRQIEETALSEGFLGSHTETTDYQALDFYLLHEYEVFGQLDGKPKGVTWYFMKKSLAEDLDAA